jgi:glyoxylase-like metal-dependent hydrolase (beta-lactamase superfamily II)
MAGENDAPADDARPLDPPVGRGERPDEREPVTDLGGDVYDLTLTDDEARYRAFVFDWDTPTLVDTGPAEAAETLLARLETVGVSPERLVITHDHHDHIGGFDAVVAAHDPETWVPDQSTIDADHDPDHRYGHEDAVGSFTAVHVPGHCDDNHALVAPDRDLVVMGDVFIGADWRGLPAGYFLLVEPVYNDDSGAAERNAERLQAYEFEAGLVFHGSSVFADARRKVDEYLAFPNKDA